MRTADRSRTHAPPLRDADIDRLFQRLRNHGDSAARDELVLRFTPMARRLAAKYRSINDDFEDLVQVATVGLIGAVDRFDPERGAAFVSFAVPTILGELKRHFRNTAWSVHVPRGTQERALQVDKAVREMTAEAGRPPSVSDLASYLELDLETVLLGLDASRAHHATSLDAPVGAGGDGEERETLAESLGSVESGFEIVDSQIALASAIRELPYRERIAVGLRVTEQLKQVEIAERMGCSQMQVSRLMRRAAQRLRDAGAIG